MTAEDSRTVEGIHHVGCATRDATALAERLSGVFDVEIAHQERFEDLEVIFLAIGGSYLEVLEPTSDDGPVAEFLDTRDGGIHHLGVATSDIRGALERARRRDIECVDDHPRAGAWGHEVAFLHPRDTGGILIEFVSTAAVES